MYKIAEQFEYICSLLKIGTLGYITRFWRWDFDFSTYKQAQDFI